MKHYFQIALIGAFLTLYIFGQTIPERAQMKALPAVKVWELYVENVEHPKVRAEIFDAMFKDERIDVITFFSINIIHLITY